MIEQSFERSGELAGIYAEAHQRGQRRTVQRALRALDREWSFRLKLVQLRDTLRRLAQVQP